MALEGLDVSQYQSVTPSLAGKAFLFARATYDVHPDTMYARHIGAAAAARIVTGAYHFGTGRSSVPAQVSAFLKAAAGAQLLALDLEHDAVPMTPGEARAFIAAVHAKGRKIGLYHSESGFPELGQDWDWVASWGVAAPSRHWQFHQYTSGGSIAGYAGRLDLDRFNGDQAALDALAGMSAAPDVPKPHRLVVDAHAVVQVATLSASGCIAGWTERRWGPRASSAPCRAPVVKHACSGGAESTVAYVTRGAFAGKWVHAGSPGVTVKP